MAAAGLAALMPNECTADAIAMAAKSALVDPNRAAIRAARARSWSMPDPATVLAELAPCLTVDTVHVVRNRPRS